MSNVVFWLESDLTCKPLRSLKEIQNFILDPPAWRTLCEPITPHSKSAIKNSDLSPNFADLTLENPHSFCHFDPSQPDVLRHENKDLPKVLICHDMANGYHDDSVIDGTTNVNAYTFYNWATVDIFCYFSHHLVTIPPLGWINVAHAHGVKVIGTFITEWAEGHAFWTAIFASEEETQNLVGGLVAIAKTLKFEGWLINIENKIEEPEKLLYFVKLLHRTLHQEIPGAELIWYDSVTKDGHLNWQNKLNELNRPFFDACDGIFTNYSWTEIDVAQSAFVAGSRVTDVYVGIDVWGRNFYGGGMFNTQAAVKVVHKNGCSLAIFAPAWTHEAMGEDGDKDDLNAVVMGEDLPRYERFLLRDKALWTSLWPYLKTKLPCTLPFKTSFCKGLGNKRRMYGEVLCNSTWFNLRHMQYQPNSALGHHEYLLSTSIRIRVVSRLTLPDGKGILKIRQSLHHFNQTVTDEEALKILSDVKSENKIDGNSIETSKEITENIVENTEQAKENTENIIENPDQSIENTEKIIKNDEETANEVEINEEVKKKFLTQTSSMEGLLDETKSGKLKNVFKRMFSIKSKKKVNDDEEPEGSSNAEKSESMVSSGNKKIKVDEEPEALSNEEKSEGIVSSGNTKMKDDEEPEALSNAERSESVVASGSSITLSPVSFSLKYDKARFSVAYVQEERECVKTWFEDSFNGGTCLRINPSDLISDEHRMIRLFHCDFYFEENLVVCMVTKALPGRQLQYLNMWLHILNQAGNQKRVRLKGSYVRDSSEETSDPHFCPLDPSSAEFRDLQTYLVVNEPDFYVPIKNSYGWQIFYFQVPTLEACRVLSVNLQTAMPDVAMLLGHVGFCVRHLNVQ